MKIFKYALSGLVVLAITVSLMPCTFAWHQPVTPNCIA